MHPHKLCPIICDYEQLFSLVQLTIEEATFPLVIQVSKVCHHAFLSVRFMLKQSYAKKIVGEENGDILGNC